MSNASIYAVVEDGIVVNTVLWDGTGSWTPPEGATVDLIGDHVYTGIGAPYVDGVFGPPPVAIAF